MRERGCTEREGRTRDKVARLWVDAVGLEAGVPTAYCFGSMWRQLVLLASTHDGQAEEGIMG